MASFRRLIGSAASALDRAVVAAMHVRARAVADRERAEEMPHEERIEALELIARSYGDEHHDSFFAEPAAIDPTLRAVRAGVFEASWPSETTPFLAEVSERYLARVENRTARARLFLGKRGRPAIVLVHGYMGGYPMFEEPQWPIAWMNKRGLDVAFPVLPFHALRGGASRGVPNFPSADPRITNEAFRQAVSDIVALARFLRARGAPHVGVAGVSLGGYTTALLATVTDAFDFAMPMIPLASVADFARDQGSLGEGAIADVQHAALERANWIASPLARPLRIPTDRVFVAAGDADRITPRAHAQRIAHHFACDLVTFPGGHLLQFGRSEAFRRLGRMLETAAIVPRRARR